MSFVITALLYATAVSAGSLYGLISIAGKRKKEVYYSFLITFSLSIPPVFMYHGENCLEQPCNNFGFIVILYFILVSMLTSFVYFIRFDLNRTITKMNNLSAFTILSMYWVLRLPALLNGQMSVLEFILVVFPITLFTMVAILLFIFRSGKFRDKLELFVYFGAASSMLAILLLYIYGEFRLIDFTDLSHILIVLLSLFSIGAIITKCISLYISVYYIYTSDNSNSTAAALKRMMSKEYRKKVNEAFTYFPISFKGFLVYLTSLVIFGISLYILNLPSVMGLYVVYTGIDIINKRVL